MSAKVSKIFTALGFVILVSAFAAAHVATHGLLNQWVAGSGEQVVSTKVPAKG